eukprot:2151451-Ditylum_brightwellii.AAC.2
MTCIQALCSIQGSKDAGRKWYLLLKAICINKFGVLASTYNAAILSWNCNNHKSLLAISTDDLLMATTHRCLYDRLKQYFDRYFDYTTYESNVIRYLNTRIIISTYGISLDIMTSGVHAKHHFKAVPFLSRILLNMNSSLHHHL